jgi:MFS family permease
MTRSDLLYVYAARALRGFGDGFAIIILPVYLAAIGFSAPQIGIVATASLTGTAILTLVVGMIAPRFELRSLLLAGAALATITGLAFPAIESFAFVLLVSFIFSPPTLLRLPRLSGLAIKPP